MRKMSKKEGLGVVHKLPLLNFGFFDPPPSWLTALLNKIYQICLVMLTFYEPPPPLLLTWFVNDPDSKSEQNINMYIICRGSYTINSQKKLVF